MQGFLGRQRSNLCSSRGELTVWMPAPGILVTRASGHIDGAIAAHFIEAGNAVIQRDGKLAGFHDWAEVNTYDSAARSRLTSWGHDVRASVREVHFLTASKILSMGIAVASILLRDMLTAHRDRAEFESALRAALHVR
jgi:hypothetical protein